MHILRQLPITLNGNVDSSCEKCRDAMQTRVTFPVSTTQSHHLFDLVHCDLFDLVHLFDLAQHATHGNCNYFLTLVDDFSRYTWTFLCASKVQVTTLLHNFLSLVKNQFNHAVKVLRSDNGTDFIITPSLAFSTPSASFIKLAAHIPHNKMV